MVMMRLLFFIIIIFISQFRNNFLKEKVTETGTNLVTLPPSSQSTRIHSWCVHFLEVPQHSISIKVCSPAVLEPESPKLGRNGLPLVAPRENLSLASSSPGDGPGLPVLVATSSLLLHLTFSSVSISSSPSLLLKTSSFDLSLHGKPRQSLL